MTTVVGYKNPNGVVIAADSQVTFGGRNPTAFNHYYKVNQVGTLPVITGMWGTGTIQGLDTTSLLMEFWQTRYKGKEPSSWTVQEVSAALHEYLREKIADQPRDALMMLVGGYSSKTFYPELYEFSTKCDKVNEVSSGQNSIIVWRGITDAIRTLWWGYGPSLDSLMRRAGVKDKKVRDEVLKQMSAAWAWGPERMAFNMPIEDAAELAEFLVELECARQRFWPGMSKTSGPVDVAVVTVHGVRWLKRKEGAR